MDALPAIRGELRLVGRRRDATGAELGIVYDPVRHRFFELGLHALEMLRHWRAGSTERLVADVQKASNLSISTADVQEMVRFLRANQLLRARPAPHSLSWFGQVEQAIGKLFFFRVPMLRPDRALDVLTDVLAPFLGRTAMTTVLLLALVALMLVLRQWDLFIDGLRPVFNVGGAFFILAVVLAKAWHELGHALAAKRLGCAVPAMGVAVMFGAPLLYTDLSDTWRLSRRRDRLLVAAGGILAEMVLAALATWGWLILPDGPARNACFFLATVAWTATLALNLNPFLRFDGYFMLSDILGIPNLQDRSFAVARGHLRRVLWGVAELPDEAVPPRLARIMLVYAYSTWVFRGGLYLGLAWTVFQLLPKIIAVPLLAAEMWILLMRPIVKEILGWWQRRGAIVTNRRGRVTLAVLGGLALWLTIPQSFDLVLPAIQAPAARQWIYPPRAAQLVEHARAGAWVQAGDILAVFRDDTLALEMSQSTLRLAMAQAAEEQAARSLHSARDLAILRERLAREAATLAGLRAQERILTVRAPFSGTVVEMADGLRPGNWHATTAPLFLLASSGVSISGLVDDRDLALVQPGGIATFHPSAADFPVINAKVSRIETLPVDEIAEDLMSSVHGGPIAAERDAAGRSIPRQGHYKISATAEQIEGASQRTLSGNLVVRSIPHSLITLGLRRLQALLVREAGA